LEKQEWNGLTDQEKQQFAGQLDLQIGQFLKSHVLGDKKPTR